MSRSQPNKPTYKYYPGENEPIPGMSVEPYDKHYYNRWKAAKKLNMKVWEMEDEPDDDSNNLREKEIMK